MTTLREPVPDNAMSRAISPTATGFAIHNPHPTALLLLFSLVARLIITVPSTPSGRGGRPSVLPPPSLSLSGDWRPSATPGEGGEPVRCAVQVGCSQCRWCGHSKQARTDQDPPGPSTGPSTGVSVAMPETGGPGPLDDQRSRANAGIARRPAM